MTDRENKSMDEWMILVGNLSAAFKEYEVFTITLTDVCPIKIKLSGLTLVR